MNLQIPDPRRYAHNGAADDMGLLADCVHLHHRMVDLLSRGSDAEIGAALRAAPSQPAYAKLWGAVCDAVNRVQSHETAIVARIFALPLVIIAGSRRPASVPGVVPDIAAIAALFEKHGALGPTRNFGIGNALCSLETIEAVQPSEVYAWTRDAG